MNDHGSVESNTYDSVLAFTQENETCISEALENNSQVPEAAAFSELVDMDDITIVTSNGQVSGRLASRILSGDLSSVSSSKSIDIDPEELLQQSCHIRDQNHISIKPSVLSYSKLSKWKTTPVNNHSTKKHKNIIYPKNDEEMNTQTISVCSNGDINNYINLLVNKLPSQSTNNTAVEQPNITPCSCFICGQVLIDPTERFSYLNSQKLFSLKIPLLQLLSDIVNQTVITDTESIDLCQKCSELVNETDVTYKHLNDLKEEITKLFNVNKRPKLVFHIFPKPTSPFNSKNSVLKKDEISLTELAFSRPRRGRNSKKRFINKNKIDELLDKKQLVKKKGGRPRKPFQCHICRRKFLTQSLNEKHLFKEHNITPNNSSALGTESESPFKIYPTKQIVKEEKPDEDKVENDKNKDDKDKKPDLLSVIEDQNTSLSISKLNIIETLNNGINSTMRPIQPKPETVVQTVGDGSVVYIMNPATSEASPSLIKVSPGYLSLKTGNHTCELCQKTFLDDKGYKMHKIAAHGLRKRRNDYDGISSENLLTHDDKKESFQKFWQCDLCSVIFYSKKLLSDHKKYSHSNDIKEMTPKEPRKEKNYSCENCDKVFNYKYELENHRETHLPFSQVGPHEFVCCLCGLKVASKAALKIHLHRFHNKDEETKDFLCAECGYMTGTKKAFSDHLRVHSDNPGQKKMCHICKKEMLPSSYKIHMLRMHGEAKHPCDICGQRFTVRSDLMKHLNTVHSTLRPYDCHLCCEKFVTSEALRYHKNKVHSTVCHYCEMCGKSYKWKGELRTHINRCHGEQKTRYQCTNCSRSYTDRKKLHNHMANKHNIAKESIYIKKQYDEKETRIKISNGEIVSSSYEPQGSLLSPQTVMASIAACSSTHLVTDEDNMHALQDFSHDQQTVEDNLNAIQDYHEQQTAITSLHNSVQLHHELQRPLSHHEENALHQYHDSSHVQVSAPHDIMTHQTLNSSIVPIQPKVQQLDQVQSIYLVSDMQMPIVDKSISS